MVYLAWFDLSPGARMPFARIGEPIGTDVSTVELAADVAAPTLVLAGARDAVVPAHASRALAEATPNGTFVTLDHVAHGFPEQSPHRTYREVARFLDLDPALSRRILGESS